MRRGRFEQLEARQMLSVTGWNETSETVLVASSEFETSEVPISKQSQFFVVKGAEFFDVATSVDEEGKPSALLTLKDTAKSSGELLFEVELELRNGLFGVARYDVTVTLAGDTFLSAYRSERFDKALQQEGATERSDPNTALDRILDAGKELASGQTLTSTRSEKLLLYADIATAADAVKQRAQDSTKEIDEHEKKDLGHAVVLLADQIAEDMQSTDTEVANAASAARDRLVETAKFSDLLWKGLGVNSRVQQNPEGNTGQVSYSAIYETGQIQMTEGIAVDVGHAAVIEIVETQLNGSPSRVAANLGTSAGTPTVREAIDDTYVFAANPDFSDAGTQPFVYVGNGHQYGTDYDVHGLFKFDVSQYSQYTTEAIVTLEPTNVLNGTSVVQTAEAFYDHSWDQNSTWNTNHPDFSPSSSLLTTGGASTWTVASNDLTAVTLEVSDVVRKTLRQGDLNFDSLKGVNGSATDVMADVAAFELAVKNPAGFAAAYNRYASDDTDMWDRGDIDGNGGINVADAAAFIAVHGFLQGDTDFDGDVDGMNFLDWQRAYGDIANYFEGDVDFSGIIDSGDLTIWSDNYGLPTPAPAAELLSLRVYAPNYDPNNFPYVEYASRDHSDVNNHPTLAVEQTPDIILKRFDTTSTGQLRVTYNTVNDSLSSLNVNLYRSPDGINYDASGLLMSQPVTGSGNLDTGLNNQFSFQADLGQLGNDVDEDYFLVAELVGTPASTPTEPNTTNNAVQFAGGSFQEVDRTLQIHGTDGTDAIDISTAVARAVDFQNSVLQSYGGTAQDETPNNHEILDTGDTLRMWGNTWKAIDFDYDITPYTILEFDFASTAEGDVHGIGFDTNLSTSITRTFQVHGTQDWGIQDYHTYSPTNGTEHFRIPVGQHYTGTTFQYLFFTNDHDVQNPGGESRFSNVRVYEEPAKVYVRAHEGNDEVLGDDFSKATTYFFGGEGDDILRGGAGENHFYGQAGNDTSIVPAKSPEISVVDAFQVLYEGEGIDTYSFESGLKGYALIIPEATGLPAGEDTLDFSALSSAITADLSATDTLETINGNLQLFLAGDTYLNGNLSGAANIENVIGTDEEDTIIGNDLDNRLEGGSENDTLTGGLGDDTYAFAGTVGLGVDTIVEETGEGSDSLDFSGLILGAGIVFDLRSTSANYQVIDANGETVALNLSGLPELENVVGTYFDDILDGDDGANELDGFYGDDNLYGHGGNDTLEGNWGSDDLVGGAGDDSLYGGPGDDSYEFAGSAVLGTDSVFEALGERSDTLDFSGLSQRVDIHLESQTTQSVSAGQLSLSALFAQEIENVVGTDYADIIFGNSLNNTLSGGNDADELHGGVGNDSLRGEAGDDSLYGDAGDDALSGGPGSDTGVGGEGNDSSDFGAGDSSPPELAVIPTIHITGGRKRLRFPFEDNNIISGSYTWQLFETDGATPYQGPATFGGNSYPSDIFHFDSNVPGTYQAKVKLTDNEGLSDMRDITIEVDEWVPPEFTYLYEYLDADWLLKEYQDVTFFYDSPGSNFSYSNPSHGSILSRPESGQTAYYYSPDLDYNGYDSFSYQWTNSFGTENVSISIVVGPAATLELVPSSTDVQNLSVNSYFPVYPIEINNDDDNENDIEDRLEYNWAVSQENDLNAFSVETSFVKEGISDDYLFTFGSGGIYGTGIRVWDSPTKNNEILLGSYYTFDELPDQVWIEGIGIGGGLTAWAIFRYDQHILTYATSSSVASGFSIDLDIDSDNDGVIERSQWEETLEDHEYGLGKLVMQNYGAPDAAASFTPMILEIPNTSAAGVADLKVRFDWEINSSAGEIEIWTKDKLDPERVDADLNNGGHRIFPNTDYTLAELGIPSGGGLNLFIAGVSENELIKTLKGVEDYGKPNETIKATLSGTIDGVNEDLLSDEVKYIVTQEDSFFYHLQFDDPNNGQESQAIRNGLASRGAYNSDPLPNFSLKPLSQDELRDNLGVPADVAAFFNVTAFDGFHVTLYQDFITGEDQYVLAFEGTDEGVDWIANIWQSQGYYSSQYDKALEIGEAISEIDTLGGHIIATGHSLGGGLASAAAIVGNMPADTFNAAGLHYDTILDSNVPAAAGALQRYFGANSFIDAYYMDWDILSLVQFFTPLQDAVGTRIELDGPYDAEIAFGAAAAGGIIGAGFATGIGWPAALAAVAELGLGVNHLVQSHYTETYLYGLLVTEGIFGDVDLLGYEF